MPQFKLQLCHEIRAGTIGRKEAQRKYALSANLVHLWLTQYDRGELDAEGVEATLVTGLRPLCPWNRSLATRPS